MQRRRFLKVASATGALVTAGCTTSGAPDGNGNEHATPIGDPSSPTPDETPTPDDTPTPEPDPGGSADGVESAEISTVGTDCASGHGDADVEFDRDERRVRIVGKIEAPDPCHEAVVAGVALADAEAEAERPTLSVDVGTRVPESQEDRMCAQCVGMVRYEASIVLSEELPGSVEVSHDGEGILTAAWDSASASAGTPDEGGE